MPIKSFFHHQIYLVLKKEIVKEWLLADLLDGTVLFKSFS